MTAETGRPRVVVVGGGIAGLAAAHRLVTGAATDDPAPMTAPEVVLVEAAPRLGGKVVTERHQGFVVEAGPDSFLAAKPAALALARQLGLTPRLVASDDRRRRVFVAAGRRLVEVPPGLALLAPTELRPFLASPLLSWRGKLRLAVEPLMPRRRGAGPGAIEGLGESEDEGDESLASFVRRRFGGEVLERLAEPLLAHIHLADPERLSMLASFPRLLDFERRLGSVTRGVRDASRRAARAEAPPPAFVSLSGGMDELPAALAAAVAAAGGTLSTGCRAVALTAAGDGGGDHRGRRGGWRLRLGDGSELAAAAVVLALPAAAAGELTAAAAPELAAGLAGLGSADAVSVSLGWRRSDLPAAPEGFGFFVPRSEGRAVVAATWASNKFAGRAPEGAVLARVFLGGALGPAPPADDDELLTRVLGELAELLGWTAEPVLGRVHRWPRGYPQYDVGHRARVARLEALAPPGLVLAGSAYHGVGLPDCIASGRCAAEAALAHLARRSLDPGIDEPPGAALSAAAEPRHP